MTGVEDSTRSSFRQLVDANKVPVSFERYTLIRARVAKDKLTHDKPVLKQLGFELIPAHSPQARGWSEHIPS